MLPDLKCRLDVWFNVCRFLEENAGLHVFQIEEIRVI
jgi:hypothetical protein